MGSEYLLLDTVQVSLHLVFIITLSGGLLSPLTLLVNREIEGKEVFLKSPGSTDSLQAKSQPRVLQLQGCDLQAVLLHPWVNRPGLQARALTSSSEGCRPRGVHILGTEPEEGCQ